jgi:hypothetical protein
MAALLALAVAACGGSSESKASTLDVRNLGPTAVVVTIQGSKIELGPGGSVSGHVYKKGDVLTAARADAKTDAAAVKTGLEVVDQTTLEGGPVFIVLSPKDGGVAIVKSDQPIPVTEKR